MGMERNFDHVKEEKWRLKSPALLKVQKLASGKKLSMYLYWIPFDIRCMLDNRGFWKALHKSYISVVCRIGTWCAVPWMTCIGLSHGYIKIRHSLLVAFLCCRPLSRIFQWRSYILWHPIKNLSNRDGTGAAGMSGSELAKNVTAWVKEDPSENWTRNPRCSKLSIVKTWPQPL